MPEFLTEYVHVDGSRWTGPTYVCDTVDEAIELAMDYPIQPLVVLGRLVHTERLGDGDIRRELDTRGVAKVRH